MLNKKIKIIEFNSNMLQFIVNLLYPYRIQDIKQDGNLVTITGTDTKTKGLIIGARAQNLRAYEEIVKKYFPELEEIKVV
jgi:transcription antitermination factor NusA-like protein